MANRRTRLDSLLKIAIDAHGGLNAWNQFENLRASVSIGGALWEQKQLPGLFNNSRIDLKLRQQQVITDLPDIGERIVFTPGEVSLESNSGTRLDARIEPRSSFAGQSADSKWDKLHAGYFCSYALWGYLTTPFLYTYPGFETREIEPWHENGELWRVLEVTFSEGIRGAYAHAVLVLRGGQTSPKASVHGRCLGWGCGVKLCVRVSLLRGCDAAYQAPSVRLRRQSPEGA